MRRKSLVVWLGGVLSCLVLALPALAQRRSFSLRAREETGPQVWYMPLSALRSPEGRQRLYKMIKEEFDYNRRLAQVLRLSSAADRGALRLVMRMYNEAEYWGDSGGMKDLALALGNLGAGAATPRFIDSARSNVPAVRLAGLIGLARVGDKRAVPVLISCLDDRNREVAETAKWGLSNLTGQPPEDRATSEWKLWWQENSESLPPITVLSVQRNILLREETDEQAPAVASKARAATTLGSLGDPKGALILVEVLRQQETRAAAGKDVSELLLTAITGALKRITGKTYRLSMGATLGGMAASVEKWYEERAEEQGGRSTR